MDLLIGRNIDGLEILRDLSGYPCTVIKSNKIKIEDGEAKKCIDYFQVCDDVKQISEQDYWSLKDEDKKFYGE